MFHTKGGIDDTSGVEGWYDMDGITTCCFQQPPLGLGLAHSYQIQNSGDVEILEMRINRKISLIYIYILISLTDGWFATLRLHLVCMAYVMTECYLMYYYICNRTVYCSTVCYLKRTVQLWKCMKTRLVFLPLVFHQHHSAPISCSWGAGLSWSLCT